MGRVLDWLAHVRVAEAEDELVDLRNQRDVIDEQISVLEGLLALRRRQMGTTTAPPPPHALPQGEAVLNATPRDETSEPVTSGNVVQAVLGLFDERPEWKSGQIIDTLIERSVLRADRRPTAYSALSRLNRSGQIRRLEEGVYVRADDGRNVDLPDASQIGIMDEVPNGGESTT